MGKSLAHGESRGLNEASTITQLINIEELNAQHGTQGGAMRRDSTLQEGDKKNYGGRGIKETNDVNAEPLKPQQMNPNSPHPIHIYIHYQVFIIHGLIKTRKQYERVIDVVSKICD